MEFSLNDPVWVDQHGWRWSGWLNALLRQKVIAVDTESNSLFAYQEQVCLIQFSAGDG